MDYAGDRVLQPDDSGLLIIGQQVRTAFNKEIDLLCMDSKGDLVIVELKRDKTPREVTAQALDYASWVKDLGAEEIQEIAAHHLKGGQSLKDAFEDEFGSEFEFPDVINEITQLQLLLLKLMTALRGSSDTSRTAELISTSYASKCSNQMTGGSCW